ncbi:ABC transporter ATP-binding protein [Aromatoleum anaerobium]|uniref:ATP-binding cassette domain-containing protein n=1 Tax=Aromatoleum anaerobium TaxID=182180 RepID=A0ABX1PKC5_9RHOO|nr:ABC transporter ATP-binding protein [Aromatoleum anaerobium]MCK0506569.1 ABC transporter ATP-binding protein [Aromatoleum anaerobium]
MIPLLNLDAVNAYYGAAHVLHDVTLSVCPGERVALVGRNGVGKTTVVNSILNLASLRGGTLKFNGVVQHGLRTYGAARAGISVVPQGRRIIPNLTIEENLLLGGAVKRPGPWNLASIYELFPILQERRNTPGTALSGGQQQMLAIGRALMANPQLLVLDEPSEGLAPVIVDQLADIFNRLANAGTALLLIEQNLSLITRVARRFYVMAKGSIIEEGALEGLDIAQLHKHIVV